MQTIYAVHAVQLYLARLFRKFLTRPARTVCMRAEGAAMILTPGGFLSEWARGIWKEISALQIYDAFKQTYVDPQDCNSKALLHKSFASW